MPVISGITATYQATWNSYFSTANNNSFPYPQAPVQNSAVIKGLATWTQAEVLGSGGTQYITTSTIYDDKGRVIQLQQQNYTGGIDVVTTQYSWAGEPLATVQKLQKNGTGAQTTVTVSRMSYDALHRLTATTRQVQNSLVNSNAMTGVINVSGMQYDALGQLKVKNLGNTKSGGSYTSNPLETLSYEYNIRGWLLGVNRAYVHDLSTADAVLGEGFTTPPSYSAGNYFGFELGYDKAPTTGSSSWTSSTNYNGNITGMIWKSVYDGQIRKYDFSYDAANRLTAADFTQYYSGSFNSGSGVNYTVNSLSYDANGNILSMNQYGLLTPTATSSSLVDQLGYSYISGTNKLQSVTDGANNYSSTLGDFKYNPTTKTSTDYAYDNNGNLTQDLNKNIPAGGITYNILNLPQTITVTGKGTITYTYDAAGVKWRKQTVEGSKTTTTLYSGGVVYQNDTLQFIAHEEGRIRLNSGRNGYVFDYYLKDHLGNTRMTITDDNTQSTPVVDATSYYPFGLVMAGISGKGPGGIPENKYKYNGKELQHGEFSDGSGLEEYDYGARFQDPQLGVWHVQDRFSEVYVALTPYQFAANNPIKNTDEAGHLLKDKDGNIIATSNGMAPSITRTVTMEDGSKQSIKIDMENVTIYTDKGTPVHALRAVKAYVAEITTDANGNQTVGEYKEDKMYKNYRSNCHGYSLADGNLWIGTEDGQASLRTILADDYSENTSGSLSLIEWTENTSEQVIVHSGLLNDDGTYNQKDDIGAASSNASRDEFTQYGARTNTYGGQRKVDEKRYSKTNPGNKTTNRRSFMNQAVKGIRITNPDEIKAIFKELGWQEK